MSQWSWYVRVSFCFFNYILSISKGKYLFVKSFVKSFQNVLRFQEQSHKIPRMFLECSIKLLFLLLKLIIFNEFIFNLFNYVYIILFFISLLFYHNSLKSDFHKKVLFTYKDLQLLTWDLNILLSYYISQIQESIKPFQKQTLVLLYLNYGLNILFQLYKVFWLNYILIIMLIQIRLYSF